MAFNVVNATITLSDLRDIVDANKPFDTGYLFSFGNRYNENGHFMVAIYDLVTVPYIQFLEEGTRYSTKHQGFISEKTVGQVNAGVQNIDKLQQGNVKRSSLISQGVMEHITRYGREGGRYDKFVGIT
jgi:hypothetical protein